MPEMLAQDATNAVEEARFAVSKAAAYVHALGRQLELNEKGWQEILEEDESRHKREIQTLQDAIHRFLDTVQRPTGTRQCEIPCSEETNNAIIELYYAVGRNP